MGGFFLRKEGGVLVVWFSGLEEFARWFWTGFSGF